MPAAQASGTIEIEKTIPAAAADRLNLILFVNMLDLLNAVLSVLSWFLNCATGYVGELLYRLHIFGRKMMRYACVDFEARPSMAARALSSSLQPGLFSAALTG
ncbi:MAG: hypothetical protein HZA50_04165 [Planctomycetes bacterium]|nr:hypothetical protein [Planctomycetota bacterium]